MPDANEGCGMIVQDNNMDAMMQNMFDAGCSENEISCFCKCLECSNKKEELVILEMRRMEILNDIHKIQYNIRLLDEMAVIVKGDST